MNVPKFSRELKTFDLFFGLKMMINQLDGGFKYFLFPTLPGEDFHFD